MVMKSPFVGWRSAPEILAQGPAGIFLSEQAAALQLGHDASTELLEHARKIHRREHEAVARPRFEDLLQTIGHHLGSADQLTPFAASLRDLRQGQALGLHLLVQHVFRALHALVALEIGELDALLELGEVGAEAARRRGAGELRADEAVEIGRPLSRDPQGLAEASRDATPRGPL